jgi:hypothetical protein
MRKVREKLADARQAVLSDTTLPFVAVGRLVQ